VGWTRSATGAEPAVVRPGQSLTIQATIDAHPGCMIRLCPGHYRIAKPIKIHTDGTGLCGHGTIVQTNPSAGIIHVEKASRVTLEGLTLTRAEGKMTTHEEAVRATGCEDLRLSRLRIIDNRTDSAAVRIEQCRHGRIEGCDIINYKRIGLDDRTASELYGYAFRAIIGDGINIRTSTHMIVASNSVVERNLLADEATKAKHNLGQLAAGRRPTKKGKFAPPGNYASNWHQGSAIVVTSPERTSHVLITGNLIENAAQGVDIHADHVTFTDNVIHYAFIGIKCMHGAKNVLITNNNVSHNDLWGLVMLPGTSAHAGRSSRDATPNVTRGNLIANNLFSDFGYGHEVHNWKDSSSRNVLQFESGPLPDNPPLTDVIVQGNIVYDPGRDRDATKCNPPRYLHAVYVDPKLDRATFRFSNNLLHPGQRGVSNTTVE
jgi:hypothetical protein